MSGPHSGSGSVTPSPPPSPPPPPPPPPLAARDTPSPSPPPPPLPHHFAALINRLTVQATPLAVSSYNSDDELTPPPPPPPLRLRPPPPPQPSSSDDDDIPDFDDVISRATQAGASGGVAASSARRQQNGPFASRSPMTPLCPSPPPPPPPPPRGAGAKPFSPEPLPSFLDDEDDEDDSDVEDAAARRQASSASPDAISTLLLAPPGAGFRPPVRSATGNKLSFTAPGLTSPLASAGRNEPVRESKPAPPAPRRAPPPPPSQAAPPAAAATATAVASPVVGVPIPATAPVAVGGTVTPAIPSASSGEDVSLVSLASQLALHLELQTFAHQRAQSIVAIGKPLDSSLIPPPLTPATEQVSRPVSGAAAAAAAATAAAAAAAAASTSPKRPPTHYIRSMSMSLHHASSPYANGHGHASGAHGHAHGPVVPVGPFTTTAAAAAAKKRRRNRARTKASASKRPDDEVLDLFGDGPPHSSSLNGTAPASPSSFLRSMRRSMLHAGAGSGSGSGSGSLLASITEAGEAGAKHPSSMRPITEDGGPSARSSVDGGATGGHSGSGGGGNGGYSVATTASSSSRSSTASSNGPGGGGASPNDGADDTEEFIPPPPPLPPSPSLEMAAALPSAVTGATAPQKPQPPAPAQQPDSQPARRAPPESDDLTSSFVPPSGHVSAHFPYRKVLAAPLRSTRCLEPPAAAATATELDTQEWMLQLLAEALRTARAEIKQICLSNLRAENAALRLRVDELRRDEEERSTSGSMSGRLSAAVTGRSGTSVEQAQRDVLRRSIRALGSHARWNHAAHLEHTAVALRLEDLRRRCQLNLPGPISTDPAFADGEFIDGCVSSGGGEGAQGDSPQHSPDSGPRPLVSHFELASKARVLADGGGGVGFGAFSPSSSPPPPSLHPHGEYGGGGGGHSSQASMSSVGLSAPLFTQVHRFPITKVNKIRKNTPRILELDLATQTLTICKHAKEGGPKGSSLGSAASAAATAGSSFAGSGSDDFANRDIVISASTIVSAELHPRHDTQLDLSFHVVPVHSSSAMMGSASFSSSAPAAPGSLSPGGGGSGGNVFSPGGGRKDKDGKSMELKNWKVLFASRMERERFHGMLRSTLLAPGASDSPGGGGTASFRAHAQTGLGSWSANSLSSSSSFTNGLGSGRNMFDLSLGPGLGSGGGDGGGGGVGGPPSSSSSDLSTPYPSSLVPGGVPSYPPYQSYTPRLPTLTPALLQSVRQLPLLPLASSLHTNWCLAKKQSGFKYGLKMEESSDGSRRTHPFLVPFHALPPHRREYNIKAVTQILSTLLSLGFHVTRSTFHPTEGETRLLRPHQQQQQLAGAVAAASANQALLATQQAQQAAITGQSASPGASSGGGSGSGSLGSAFAPLSLGSLSPSLLSLLDVFASGCHDLWALDKLSRGFRYGPRRCSTGKTHPGLVPYAAMLDWAREAERAQVLRVLGTLVEWGYVIAEQGQGAAAAAATAPAPMAAAGGGAAALSRQPSSGSLGSLKRAGGPGPGVAPSSQRTPAIKLTAATFVPPS